MGELIMVITNDFPMMVKKVSKLLFFTNEYDFFDLVKAVFCINICINNRSALESGLALNATIVNYNSTGNKRISTYLELCEFFKQINPILQTGLMDDYIVEDFGDVMIRYQEKIYNVILGTGHNQVFGCLYYLPYLADMTDHKNELRELLKYYSGLIEYFKADNVNDGKGCVRFELPSEALFSKTQRFFEEEIKKYDVFLLKEIMDINELPIEKQHFAENEDNVYPLFNVSLLLDAYDKWYEKLDQKKIIKLANIGILYLIDSLCKLNDGEKPTVLYPVKVLKNGNVIENSSTYAFVAHCKKGTIIALNSDEYSPKSLKKEIEFLDEAHKNNELCLVETISKRGDGQLRGVTISNSEPIKYIFYNSHTNVEETCVYLGKRKKEKLRCSAIDMVYYLSFMEDFNELYEYLKYSGENEFEQMIGFGGESTKFLSWKNQDHMFAKGAIQFGVIDVGYDTENTYVVDYYKNELSGFPWESGGFLFKNPFVWKIKKIDNGYFEYVNKYAVGFGGNLKVLKNNCVLYFNHNLDFYIKTNTFEIYKDVIPFVDDLNSNLIKDCEIVFEEEACFGSKCLQIMFMPREYAITVAGENYFKQDRMYVFSDMNISGKSICIRYAIDVEKIYKDISVATDRSIEVIYFAELFKPLKERFSREYNSLIANLEKIRSNKKSVDTFMIELGYLWNEKGRGYYVSDKAYLDVRKNIAFICKKHEIKEGEYYGKDANDVIRKMQKTLIEDFEAYIVQFKREEIHSKVLEIYADAVHSVNVHKRRYNSFNNVDENVVEEVRKRIISMREEDKHHARSLLYLIETNLYIDRISEKIILYEHLEYLLAYANWLVVLNDNADICHFTDKEFHINVTFEYVIDVVENEGRAEEFCNVAKRVYGDKGYSRAGDKGDLEFVEKIKRAFKKDTDFEMLDMFNFLQYLQFKFKKEDSLEIYPNVYCIDKNELLRNYVEFMKNEVDLEMVQKILCFLTVQPEFLKTCKGKTEFYLPIGQRKQRNNRFEVKPIWNERDMIVFSPPVIHDIHSKWLNGTLDFYLPYEEGLNNTKKVISEWKACYEKRIVYDIESIFKINGYGFIKTNLELCKIDKKNKHPQYLGDYDVFVIDSNRKEIWTIECKVLEKVGSFFEMYRQQNRFFNEHKEDELFQRRIEYIKEHYKKVLEFYNFRIEEYNVVPYMVMNKVLVSRYKQLPFRIVSFGELKQIISTR